MVDAPDTGHDRAARRRPARDLVVGLVTAVVLVVLLVVPVVVMLLLPPRGTPTLPGDGLHLVLLVVIGAVVGAALRMARTRPVLAVTAAAVMSLLALWFQRGTWWTVGAVPAPPLLPTLPPTLVVVAGALIGAAAVAVTGVRSDAPAAPGLSAVVGAVTGGLFVLVVEADVWGLGVFRQTFDGPWGMSRTRWLGLVFLLLVVASILLGWVASSVRHRPTAPAVAGAIVLLVVLVVAVAAGLGGPPRTTLYGLALGMLAVALAPARRASGRGRQDVPARDTADR